MKQLGILDSAFINLEQANTPQHVGGMGIYDPSTAPGGFVRFKDVIASFERRLGNLPLFRTRLVEVPGGIDRPYWIKDANFDVEFHLRHIALPEPGDWRQLCIQVARLHSRPLDLSRPLWEAYIIEGLDNIPNVPKGSFAVYTKMHHSLVDGAGGASFMAALHDLVPNPEQGMQPEAEPRLVDVAPSMAELLTKATFNSVVNTAQLVGGTLKNTRDMGKYALGILRKEIPRPDISAPKTILNRPVGPHRVFDAAEFPLEGFKDIKNAVGVTVNDVALGIIGGALLRYLKSKGEAPQEGSLAAALPLNMRTRRGSTDDNNQVGSVFTSLHTDIEDPLERLTAIRESTREAKESGEASPMVDALKIAGVFSPLISRSVAGFWARNDLSRHLPVNISTCISNVPGPDFPLYCAGAKMVDYYGLGVLTPGMGIFHLVFSYSGKVTLSVLADRDIMPDPEFYHDCLVGAYEELYAAAIALGAVNARAAGVAAKAKISSPKRQRPVGSSTPKNRRPAAAATRKSASKKASPSASSRASTTTAKKKAKTRTAKAASAGRKKAGKAKTPAARPKAKRRAAPRARPKVQPKLRSA
ncbi:MAG: wax ester/triacylglycerol synthase family O-acyltransferase [Halioglobus sp.]|nr:wax ester/triacylglycerol synthase family O-acyltransferase [Halioglobus sp.]